MKILLDTKYKDVCPTLEEFSLVGVDFQEIEREFLSYQEHRKSFSYYFWNVISIIAGFGGIFGGIGLVITAVRTVLLLWENSTSSIDIEVLIAYFCFVATTFFVYSFAEKRANKIYNKPFKNQEIYDNIQAYTKALSTYVMWQERKKKNYWYSLNGREFELCIADLFEKHGWTVRICKQGGDGGIDIEASLGKKRLAIQCKAHKSKVSPSVARDLLGTAIAGHYNAACLITLEGGTTGTVDFCKKNGIVLWDINNILNFQGKI